MKLLIPRGVGLFYGMVEGFYFLLYAMANYYPQNKTWDDAFRPELQVVAAIHAAATVLAIRLVYGGQRCCTRESS